MWLGFVRKRDVVRMLAGSWARSAWSLRGWALAFALGVLAGRFLH